MKDITKNPDIRTDFDLKLLGGDPSKILFFDIETTGLSAHTSSLYLIGMLWFSETGPVFRQLFAEHMGEELSVLRIFFDFSGNFDTLVHFNGDTFDIPYIETCSAQYSLSCPLRELKSIDIMKSVRRRRNLLGLDSCSQKTVELFLGLSREDKYSGGELIPVYKAYEKDRDPEKERFLLLHNEEDVCNMPSLLPVLTYMLALSADRPLFRISENYASKSGEKRMMLLKFPFRFPRELHTVADNAAELTFRDDEISLLIPEFVGTLRFFYANYRDYCYLPREDRAIHKKLAAFVEKPYKVPCTPDNCYTNMEGSFLPELKGSGLPLFSESRKADRRWHLIADEEAFFEQYCRELLGSL